MRRGADLALVRARVSELDWIDAQTPLLLADHALRLRLLRSLSAIAAAPPIPPDGRRGVAASRHLVKGKESENKEPGHRSNRVNIKGGPNSFDKKRSSGFLPFRLKLY